MASKTPNNLNLNLNLNLNVNLRLRELKTLAESMQSKMLNETYLLVLRFDKRNMTKKARESYSTRYIESFYVSGIDNIFRQPNVSKFTIHNLLCSQDGTYVAEGKLSNLSVIFTVDTTEKDSKYPRSTYRVEFKDKESLLRGVQVYTVLATQSKDRIIRRELRAYFTALALL